MSGGGDVYTEWNMYMDSLVDDDDTFRFLCVLAKLDIVDKDKLYDMRNKVLSNMFGAQS